MQENRDLTRVLRDWLQMNWFWGFKSSNKQHCSMIKVELQCGNYTTMRDGDISKLAELSTASFKLICENIQFPKQGENMF